MSTITISVKDKNLKTLMTIIDSLKDDLIDNIEVDNKPIKNKTKYQPKKPKIVMEGEPTQNKYMNTSVYKQRLSGK